MTEEEMVNELCEELSEFTGFQVIYNKNKRFICKKGALTHFENGILKVYLALPVDLYLKLLKFYTEKEGAKHVSATDV